MECVVVVGVLKIGLSGPVAVSPIEFLCLCQVVAAQQSADLNFGTKQLWKMNEVV